jgi:hypothetical protein
MVLATVRTLIERLMRLFHGFVAEKASPEIVKIVAADPSGTRYRKNIRHFGRNSCPTSNLTIPNSKWRSSRV